MLTTCLDRRIKHQCHIYENKGENRRPDEGVGSTPPNTSMVQELTTIRPITNVCISRLTEAYV